MTINRKVIHDGFKNRYAIVKDGKTITLIPLSPKQVFDDQLKLKRECDDRKRENLSKDMGEKRSPDSSNSKSPIKLVESRGKTRGVKKVNMCDYNSMKRIKETT